MAKENIREMTHNKVDKIMDKAENIKENGSNAYANAKDKAVVMREDFDSIIRANPEKSILIAAGVGAVVGIALSAVMMRRRD